MYTRHINPMYYIFLPVTFLLFLISNPAETYAQDIPEPDPDTLDVSLDEIEIEAARRIHTEKSAPFSVNRVTRSVDEVRFEPALSLDKVIGDLPGVWVNNRENYALGERMSIRGMGWRAAFGVRGIQVLLDGIPLTTPDGQTTLDIIDPAFIQSAEIIRGPSSSFWGNSGGGTLFLSTQDYTDYPNASFRTFAGSHEIFKVEGRGSIPFGNHRAQVFTSFTDRDGYREHSQFRSTRIGGNAQFDMNPDTDILITASYVNSPDVRHPGSLTREEFEDDPTMANSLFRDASAGKSWEQGQFGITLDRNTPLGHLNGTFYGIRRDLNNPLPFGEIEVDRSLGGTRVALQNEDHVINFGIGADAAIQRDDRKNWGYDNDFNRDEITLEQRETVTNAAGFATVGTSMDYFNISGGMRYDILHFNNDDFLQAGGEDQSGTRLFTAFNPNAGVSLNMFNQLWYANIGTSFESPTTTELVNRPDMTGGFNPDLDPETTLGYETGFRGGLANIGLEYDLAGYYMEVTDRLIPFQTEEGGDRVFYRNQNATVHQGFEGMVTIQPVSFLRLQSGYNYSAFVFEDEDPEIDGNQIPGIPEHRLYGKLRWMPSDWWFAVNYEYVSEYFVNDINTESTDPYFLLDLEVGHRGLPFTESMIVQPFIKIDNVTNQRYSSSVNINANAGRYYEPGAGITVNAGFTIGFKDPNG